MFGTNGNIYVLNGVTQHIFELTPNGSSLVRSVALPSVITDAEGLAYDAASDIFYVASGKTKGKIFALDHDMHLISTLDLLNDPSYRNPTGGISPKIKGLELAPSSDPNDGTILACMPQTTAAIRKPTDAYSRSTWRRTGRWPETAGPS